MLAGWVAAGASAHPALGAVAPPSKCDTLARSPWPAAAAARTVLREEMEASVKQCVESAPFLALLGALWLEAGEPRQALLWLERALLLDPYALGAKADHALALAALGEPAARDALLDEWRRRADVPPALMRRLRGRPPGDAGDPAGPARWLRRGELNLRAGADSNLDRSPTLDSITLTPPDGPIEVPIAVPLRPRRGEAVQLDIGWRVGRDSGQNSLWQASVAAAARHSPSEPGTDWYYVQGRIEHWHARGPWRAQFYGTLGRSGGPLSEAYTAARIGAAGERDLGGCTYRAAAEAELRRQQDSTYLDGDIGGITAFAQCPLDRRDLWRLAVEVRHSLDVPSRTGRPGGRQQQSGLAAKVTGTVAGMQLEAVGIYVLASDAVGYSPLLENNARRWFRQAQVAFEISYSLRDWLDDQSQGFVQWGAHRQRSNLAIFRNEGSSISLGIRWRW